MALTELLHVPPEDRDLFVRWMVRVARADGILDAAEMAVIHEIINAWSLSTDRLIELHRALREGPDLGKGAPPGFLDPRTPYLLVRMLIQLGHEDGSYDDAEREEVREVARRYRIPAERVIELEDWVDTYMQHRARGRTLLEP